MRVRLTDRFCDNAKATTGQADYFDEKVTGLALRVGKRTRTFTLHHKGKRITLGTYPTMTLAAARGAALELRQTGTIAPKSGDTLRDVAELYLNGDGAKLRTIAERRAVLERHVLPTLGKRSITEIKRSEVVAMLDALPGDRIHDLALSYLQRLFNWYAIRNENFNSPLVRGMAKGSKARERVLTDAELRVIWAATEPHHKEPGPTNGEAYGAYVRLLLLTACRRNEVLDMTRSELSPDCREWLIPARRTKQDRDHSVPLSKTAQEIVASLLSVFNGPTISHQQPTNAEGRLFLNGTVRLGRRPHERLLAASGTDGWTLHDLRRTARSLMSRAGVPSDHAERCLGHVIGGVRGVYDRHAYVEEKRAAFEALAKEIAKVTGDPSLC